MTNMVYEIAAILLGAAVGAALVLYAAPRGFFGHPRRRGTSVASTAPSYAPSIATEQVAETTTTVTTATEAPAAAEPAPSPAPTQAIYETVQPDTAPPPAVPATAASVVSFGASARPSATRTYRRRAAPRRSTATKATPHRTRKR